MFESVTEVPLQNIICKGGVKRGEGGKGGVCPHDLNKLVLRLFERL